MIIEKNKIIINNKFIITRTMNCEFCEKEISHKYCVRCRCRYKDCEELIDYLQRKKDDINIKFTHLLYCFKHSGSEYWREYRDN